MVFSFFKLNENFQIFFFKNIKKQFRASSDRTWEETVPEKGVFTAPSLPNQSGNPPSDGDNAKKPPAGKRSRWD